MLWLPAPEGFQRKIAQPSAKSGGWPTSREIAGAVGHFSRPNARDIHASATAYIEPQYRQSEIEGDFPP